MAETFLNLELQEYARSHGFVGTEGAESRTTNAPRGERRTQYNGDDADHTSLPVHTQGAWSLSCRLAVGVVKI